MSHRRKEIKQKIVRAYQEGNSNTHLVSNFKVHRNSIRNWIRLFQVNLELPRLQKPGSGRPCIFHSRQGERLLTLLSQPASAFGFETDFWTTARIQRACLERLKIKASRMAIHRTLVKFGDSYKKPEKRYFEASQDKQESWAKRELIEIKKRIQEKRAILYFQDESSIDSYLWSQKLGVV